MEKYVDYLDALLFAGVTLLMVVGSAHLAPLAF